jgi:hypothetical protein
VKVLASALVALAFAGTANAVPPEINGLGHQDRHPRATIAAPRAAMVTIYIASKPDQGSDGRFFSENVEEIDFLTDSEIQTGVWLSEEQLDPGTHYVMLNASADFGSCYISSTGTYDPACADGNSAVVRLVVPKPPSRYSTNFRRYSALGQLSLVLRATRLGENQAYRLCYRLRTRRRVCLRGTLNGFDWNRSAKDSLTVSTRRLARRTAFTWYVGKRRIAARKVRR